MYDTRSDVWSWGVMTVELITQQKPYATLYATPVQIAIQVHVGRGFWGARGPKRGAEMGQEGLVLFLEIIGGCIG
jgi:hypothetical protein